MQRVIRTHKLIGTIYNNYNLDALTWICRRRNNTNIIIIMFLLQSAVALLLSHSVILCNKTVSQGLFC